MSFEITSQLEKILPFVSKPGRYIGQEWNSVKKDFNKVKIKIALCYPDIYDIGMSNLGFQILYHLLNKSEDILCERVFAPWFDLEKFLKEKKLSLFSLESHTPLKFFDIIGFSLSYEMNYTNVLNILELSKIPLIASDRNSDFPLIIAGGSCCFNPEPLADFIDLFVIGEGEEVILEIVEIYKKFLEKKIKQKKELLKELSLLNGVYVPSLFNGNTKIKKRIILDLDKAYFLESPLVPFVNIVQERVNLEIFRGCSNGCRFCQAGIIYRPKRERSLENLKKLSLNTLKNTGFEEIALLSLSTSDYSKLDELLDFLVYNLKEKGISISLPSLNAETFPLNLAKRIKYIKKAGLTLVPETGTVKLRNVINKKISEENLFTSIDSALSSNFRTLKLYFMIGLPKEKDEDIEGIIDLIRRILKYVKRVSSFKKINVSISSFVPKPHTPFQWEKQIDVIEIEKKQKYLISNLRDRKLSLSWHSKELSFLEGIFSRGDRKLGKVLYNAFKLGCKFDAWDEFFNYNLWKKAFEETQIDPLIYTNERNLDETLPWDFIDTGVSKEYLLLEREKAYQEKISLSCDRQCLNCGLKEKGWC